jgi:DNA polymerase-2
MRENRGWFCDVYTHPGDGQLVLWVIDDEDNRRLLRQYFPVTFYAAGKPERLRLLWRFLESQPVRVRLGREERRDLLTPHPLTVLSVQVEKPAEQPRLLRQAAQKFSDLDFYDADLPLPTRYAAAFDVFPLVRCRWVVDENGWVRSLAPLESRWELDPQPPPLRILDLRPDSEPFHAHPAKLIARCGRYDWRLSLGPERPFLACLAGILRRVDPDLILSDWGDTWLFPYLLKLSGGRHDLLPLCRDPERGVQQKEKRTYHSYGQIVHRGQQVLLHGRWHIDRRNAMMFSDYGLEGVAEMARVSGLPVQVAARNSPGAGITSMEMVVALQEGILVPYHKQQTEQLKTARDLIEADHGGLVAAPLAGLHETVAEIDAVSLYPSIIRHFNLSPETMDGSGDEIVFVPGLSLKVNRDREGFLPRVLAPLLDKRIAIKYRLAGLHPRDCRCPPLKARASALKWLLVVSFGYTGYRHAKFGRIEVHQAITAYAREVILRAKEVAEAMGFEVLHMYVDCLWVRKPGLAKPADFQPLLDAIVDHTGLPVALDGIFNWVAFLPSRLDARVSVANRYFGVFQGGEIKVRGIESRRRDTPAFIAQAQMEIIQKLAKAATAEEMRTLLPDIVVLLRAKMRALRQGRVRQDELVLRQRLSRALADYRTPSPAARAAAQLQEAGKTVNMGESVRLIYTRGDERALAWDLPERHDPRRVDVERYTRLLLRAAAAVLQPLGADESVIRAWLDGSLPAGALPVVLPLLQAVNT